MDYASINTTLKLKKVSAKKGEREGKVTGGRKQEQSIPIESFFKDSRPQRLSRGSQALKP